MTASRRSVPSLSGGAQYDLLARKRIRSVARLSILGCPWARAYDVGSCWGCVFVIANRSKPNVAFTRSRRIVRTVSGSPPRNRVAASYRSAWANAGAHAIRVTAQRVSWDAGFERANDVYRPRLESDDPSTLSFTQLDASLPACGVPIRSSAVYAINNGTAEISQGIAQVRTYENCSAFNSDGLHGSLCEPGHSSGSPSAPGFRRRRPFHCRAAQRSFIARSKHGAADNLAGDRRCPRHRYSSRRRYLPTGHRRTAGHRDPDRPLRTATAGRRAVATVPLSSMRIPNVSQPTTIKPLLIYAKRDTLGAQSGKFSSRMIA